jgi:flagellar basal body-associated protein FliL
VFQSKCEAFRKGKTMTGEEGKENNTMFWIVIIVLLILVVVGGAYLRWNFWTG